MFQRHLKEQSLPFSFSLAPRTISEVSDDYPIDDDGWEPHRMPSYERDILTILREAALAEQLRKITDGEERAYLHMTEKIPSPESCYD